MSHCWRADRAGALQRLLTRADALGVRTKLFVSSEPGLRATPPVPVPYLLRGDERGLESPVPVQKESLLIGLVACPSTKAVVLVKELPLVNESVDVLRLGVRGMEFALELANELVEADRATLRLDSASEGCLKVGADVVVGAAPAVEVASQAEAGAIELAPGSMGTVRAY
jgi:hypothetical protein